MDNVKRYDLKGLKYFLIGLIMSVFPFISIVGFILIIVGFFKLAHIKDYFRRSRNFYIGAIIFAVLYACLSWLTFMPFVAIIPAIIYALMVIFEYKADKYMIFGCHEIAVENNDTYLAERLMSIYKFYRIAMIIGCILSFVLAFIPVISFIGIIITSIALLIIKIFMVYRFYQTYEKYHIGHANSYGTGESGATSGNGTGAAGSADAGTAGTATSGAAAGAAGAATSGTDAGNAETATSGTTAGNASSADSDVNVAAIEAKAQESIGGDNTADSGNTDAGGSQDHTGSDASGKGSGEGSADGAKKSGVAKAGAAATAGAAAAGAAAAGVVSGIAGKVSGASKDADAAEEDPVTMIMRPDIELEYVLKNSPEQEDDEKTTILEAAPPVVILTSINGDENIKIEKDGFILGRSREKTDHRIANPSISSVHAKIHISENGCSVEDMNSSNHTYVNGKMIEPDTKGSLMAELNNGDILKLAEEEFKVEIAAGGSSTGKDRAADPGGYFIAESSKTGEKIDIKKTTFTLGREKGDADLKVSDKNTVGRLHASIHVNPGTEKVYIKDENSANGTFINGGKLSGGEEKEIQDRDEIKLSDVVIRFRKRKVSDEIPG